MDGDLFAIGTPKSVTVADTTLNVLVPQVVVKVGSITKFGELYVVI